MKGRQKKNSLIDSCSRYDGSQEIAKNPYNLLLSREWKSKQNCNELSLYSTLLVVVKHKTQKLTAFTPNYYKK